MLVARLEITSGTHAEDHTHKERIEALKVYKYAVELFIANPHQAFFESRSPVAAGLKMGRESFLLN